MPWHGAEMIHLYAEAFKRAYADRNYYLADPDFVKMPLERMVSMDYADQRAAHRHGRGHAFDGHQARGRRAHGATQTTHYSIVDPTGNAVAVTTTLNSCYGSGVTV